MSQPLGGAAEHASPGIARNSLDRIGAGKLPGLLVASLKDGEDRPVLHPASAMAALSGAHRFSPYPYPSATRDRALEAILRPVDHPKSP